uniref:Uncharacterized protein n=1 Tax=Oryza brachyantha TaxID=4533 RepID=J3LTF7_ORYBR
MAKLAALVATLTVAVVVVSAAAVSTAHGAVAGRRVLENRSVTRIAVPSAVAGAPSSGAALSDNDDADCDNKVPVFGP